MLCHVGQRLLDDPDQLHAHLGRQFAAVAEYAQGGAQVGGGGDPVQLHPDRLVEGAHGGHAVPAGTPHRPPALAQRVLDRGLGGGDVGGHRRSGGGGTLSRPQPQHGRGQTAAERVVRRLHRALPLGRDGRLPGTLLGDRMHARVGDRDRGVPGELVE